MLCPECGKKMVLPAGSGYLWCPEYDWTEDGSCKGSYELQSGVDYINIGGSLIPTLDGLRRILSEVG